VSGMAGGHPNFVRANAAKAAAAGSRNATLAREALQVLGDSCPAPWREAAELRIASPAASWARIATAVPAGCGRVNKDVLAARLRRLLVAAGVGPFAGGGDAG
jgi:DNA-binding transcriptional regulator WhiA